MGWGVVGGTRAHTGCEVGESCEEKHEGSVDPVAEAGVGVDLKHAHGDENKASGGQESGKAVLARKAHGNLVVVSA